MNFLRMKPTNVGLSVELECNGSETVDLKSIMTMRTQKLDSTLPSLYSANRLYLVVSYNGMHGIHTKKYIISFFSLFFTFQPFYSKSLLFC